VLATVLWYLFVGPVVAVGAQSTDGVPDPGEDLFGVLCSSCHGTDGGGTDRGPSLVGVGAASADFVLATGRMPAAGVGVQPPRNPHSIGVDERAALVAFVAGLGGGPAVPEVDVAAGDVVAGGVAFRENCAACHQAAGAGAALEGGRAAPSLAVTAPTQIVEAMVIGPGAMPRFGALSDQDRVDIAAYVGAVTGDPDPGGVGLGRIGPVAEGFLAWAGGAAALIALTGWVAGRRHG
jgi:ubiquinol-cytochrome c reductase cytochrome c subunit